MFSEAQNTFIEECTRTNTFTIKADVVRHLIDIELIRIEQSGLTLEEYFKDRKINGILSTQDNKKKYKRRPFPNNSADGGINNLSKYKKDVN